MNNSKFNKTPDYLSIFGAKLPPQCNDIEEAVLGAILLEKEKQQEVFDIIPNSDCFYLDAHQKIYAAIQELSAKGSVVDLLTVTQHLISKNELEAIGGAYFITQLTMAVLSSAHVEDHARIVMEKYMKRELIKSAGKIISDSYDDTLDVFDILNDSGNAIAKIESSIIRTGFKRTNEIAKEVIEEIEEKRVQKSVITGITTGFSDLNDANYGWQEGHLIIIAARPGTGKTAFTLNLARNAAMNGIPVGFFSLEMSNKELFKRLLCMDLKVEMDSVTIPSKFSFDEYERLHREFPNITRLPIVFDDQASLSMIDLRAKARRMKVKHGVKMIIVDYLQLMKGDSKAVNREAEISKISRDLKVLTKELQIPIIALSQLNRSVEARATPRPRLSDLRESGSIEQDADEVNFLFLPDKAMMSNETGTTDIGIAAQKAKGKLVLLERAKARHGVTDIFSFDFQGNFQLFLEISKKNVSFGLNNDLNDNPF